MEFFKLNLRTNHLSKGRGEFKGRIITLLRVASAIFCGKIFFCHLQVVYNLFWSAGLVQYIFLSQTQDKCDLSFSLRSFSGSYHTILIYVCVCVCVCCAV